MNGTRTMMSFSVAALLLGACQPQAAQFTDQDRSILTATFDSALTYFRAKNWKAWAGLYTEDGVLLPAHAPTLHGRAALVTWGQSFPPIEELTFSNVEVWGEGNMGYGTSGLALKVQGAPPDTGKQLVVFRRPTGGRWAVVAVAFSSDLPLPRASQPTVRNR